jgi:thiol-disulfide isomerase/thioredoxin
MKKLWRPLVLLLVVGFIAVDLFFDYRDGIAHPVTEVAEVAGLSIGTTVGDLAPDFTGTTLDGETIRLGDLRGKVVLVNDFASWCGPCLAETPHLVEVFNANAEDVVFIGLNLQESEDAVVTYRDDFAVTYPLVLDPDGRLTDIYKPIGLPTSWFIDPDGVVRYVHVGPMTAGMIQRALDEVAAGREPDLATLTG